MPGGLQWSVSPEDPWKSQVPPKLFLIRRTEIPVWKVLMLALVKFQNLLPPVKIPDFFPQVTS
jgi:hypothetical protein